jgi:hypothetical protein
VSAPSLGGPVVAVFIVAGGEHPLSAPDAEEGGSEVDGGATADGWLEHAAVTSWTQGKGQ